MLFDDIFGLTLLRCVFLPEWLLPRRPGAVPPRSVTAILAPLRAHSLVSSALLPLLPLRERDCVRPGRRCWPYAFDCYRRMHAQMQPPARPVYPRAWKPRSTWSSSRGCHRACHPLAFCACLSAAPGCAERPLTPAQTAPVCLRCPTSCASGDCRRPPLLRVHCIDAAALASPLRRPTNLTQKLTTPMQHSQRL